MKQPFGSLPCAGGSSPPSGSTSQRTNPRSIAASKGPRFDLSDSSRPRYSERLWFRPPACKTREPSPAGIRARSRLGDKGWPGPRSQSGPPPSRCGTEAGAAPAAPHRVNCLDSRPVARAATERSCETLGMDPIVAGAVKAPAGPPSEISEANRRRFRRSVTPKWGATVPETLIISAWVCGNSRRGASMKAILKRREEDTDIRWELHSERERLR